MALKPIKFDSGQVINMKTAATGTIAKWDGLDQTAGLLVRSTTGRPKFIALETGTSTGTSVFIDVLPVSDQVYFEVDTDSNTADSYVGTKVINTDHDTINENETSSGYFLICENVGAASDKQSRGYFSYVS